MYVLETQKQIAVLRLLSEGCTISGASRLTSVHRDTCTRLMLRFGEGCRRFLAAEMRDLSISCLEIDELWTFCGKKAKQWTSDGPYSHETGEFYLFWALDQETRLVPHFLVGRRTEATAHAFMHELASCIKLPKRHGKIDFKKFDKPILKITTDGFKPYRDAIEYNFGPYAEYGQLVKNFKKDKDGNKTLDITKKQIIGKIEPADITTSLVERTNLNARTFMRRLMRKSLGFSKRLPNLQAATATYVANYNYCWRLRTFKTTPAVRAGIAKDEWRFSDLYFRLREWWPELFLLQEGDDKAA